jgi:hypothetical protein
VRFGIDTEAMDLYKAIQELYAEKEKLERVIASLEELQRTAEGAEVDDRQGAARGVGADEEVLGEPPAGRRAGTAVEGRTRREVVNAGPAQDAETGPGGPVPSRLGRGRRVPSRRRTLAAAR